MEQPKPQHNEEYKEANYCNAIQMIAHYTEILQVKQSKFNQNKLDEYTKKITKLLNE